MDLFSKLFGKLFGKRKKQGVSPKVVTFPISGKQVPLAVNVDQFCEMVVREEECAVIIPLREYKDATRKMMQRFGNQKNPYSFPLICCSCAVRLDQSPTFMAAITGFIGAPNIIGVAVVGSDRTSAGRSAQCFRCGGDMALLVYSRDRI